MVDYTVAGLVSHQREEMTIDVKRDLAAGPGDGIGHGAGDYALQTCLERAAQSLAQSFETGKPALLPAGEAAVGHPARTGLKKVTCFQATGLCG